MHCIADIPLALGLRRLVDLWIDQVRCGVRPFWRGGPFANGPAVKATSLLNLLMRLLRFTFVLLATHLDLPPLRPRASVRRAPRAASPKKAAFPLFARYKIGYDHIPPAPRPAGLARAAQRPRDGFLTVQRKLDALTRALSDPMPIIRRMARRLPTQLMVFGWRPPRRLPCGPKREIYESIIEALREARWQLSEWRRRRRDIEAAASGSGGSGEREGCA